MAHFGPFWGAGPGLSRPAGPAVLRTAAGGFAAPPGQGPGFPGGPFGGPAGGKSGSPEGAPAARDLGFIFCGAAPAALWG